MKLTSIGGITWQKGLGGDATDRWEDIDFDDAGNIYVAGFSNSTGGEGNNDILVAKYDSSGTLLWHKKIGTAGAELGLGITADPSGGAYVAGYYSPSQLHGLIVKYDTDGAVVWERELFASSAGTWFRDIQLDQRGDIFVVGTTTVNGNTDLLITKFPGDGSGEGTYGPMTYQASSLTHTASPGLVETPAPALTAYGDAGTTNIVATYTEQAGPLVETKIR